jgi:N-acetyl-alpha-D-glucosaminyl L-malate synthase BshA
MAQEKAPGPLLSGDRRPAAECARAAAPLGGKGSGAVRIGMVCYASHGGSGVVASELARQLARRGHTVHVFSDAVPFRLAGAAVPGVRLHRVEAPGYPLLHTSPYDLALAGRIAEVASDEGLDVVHVHYAVPHLAGALLARDMLGVGSGLRVVATLHGTDVTRVGGDGRLAPALAHLLARCDAVTAVSQSLRAAAYRAFGFGTPIRVIHNFVDLGEYRRGVSAEARAALVRPGERLLLHISNFRPVKRVDDAVRVLAQVRRRLPARLVLVGDGPERPAAERLARSLGLGDAVAFLGTQNRVIDFLSAADVLLLPSSEESFGLVALEAMACELPVVASRVGGLRELVADGESGLLCRPEAVVPEMAHHVLRVLADPELHRALAAAGRRRAEQLFGAPAVVRRYECLYQGVQDREGQATEAL